MEVVCRKLQPELPHGLPHRITTSTFDDQIILIETHLSPIAHRNTSHASVFDRTPEGMAGSSAKSAFWLCHSYGVKWPGWIKAFYSFSVVTQQVE
jgi:hypothetical protein